MTCEKIPYGDRKAALKELRRMQRTMRGGVIPIRVYYCRPCRGWHTTSKPIRKAKG